MATTVEPTAPNSPGPKKRKQQQRSPNYPAIGLKASIGLVRKLYDAAKRAAVGEQVAVTAMGYRGLNGTTRGHLSALKKYGLLDDEAAGVRVSDLAMRILINPEGSEDRQTAISAAAFRPEIFREIYHSHRDVNDAVLKSYLVLSKQFSEGGAVQFIQAFRETVSLASGQISGYDADMNPDPQVITPAAATGMFQTGQQQPRLNPPRLYSWPLDDDTTAEVRIIGSAVSRDHLDALIEYLEVAKKRLSERKRDDGQA